MITADDLLEKIKTLLEISETKVYDEQLKILIGASIIKLQSEGVNPPENLRVDWLDQYIVCVFINVASGFDMDLDLKVLRETYNINVANLRLELGEDKTDG